MGLLGCLILRGIKNDTVLILVFLDSGSSGKNKAEYWKSYMTVLILVFLDSGSSGK